MLLCSRQVGKTLTSASLALVTALVEAPALVLVTAPSSRQSAEFMHVVKLLHRGLLSGRERLGGEPMPLCAKDADDESKEQAWIALPKAERETALQLHLHNGSRIIGLPGTEATIRGYSSASLLIVDEASRIKDGLVPSIRPMLAVSGGRLIVLSTPFGKRGWFYEEWERKNLDSPFPENAWRHEAGSCERFRVPAYLCPRLTREFLRDERKAIGGRWYRQEYECSFEAAMDAVFDPEDVRAAVANDLEPWSL